MIRTIIGPFHFGMSVNSPINAETIFAASFLQLILSSSQNGISATHSQKLNLPGIRNSWLIAFLCIGTLAAYIPSLQVEFLADDYAHLLAVSKADAHYAWNLFTVPAADHFFRPVGMLSYLLDIQWAGFSPFKWHLSAVILHIINVVLVYFFCRAMNLLPEWSFFSAAFFSLHGSRPEVVTWIAARFDLIATAFTLATLIIFIRQVQSPSRWRRVVIVCTTIGALLSKEFAYTIPILLMILIFFRKDLRKTVAYRTIVIILLIAVCTFFYRWLLLKGIGGYQDQHGSPTILNTNLWLIFKALGLRLWAILFFPLNWTDSPHLILKTFLSSMIAGLLFLCYRIRPSSETSWGLLLTLISSLPVYHILLISSDLEKSRVIYLGSAFFALFLGKLLEQFPAKFSLTLAGIILCFQFFALQHNLRIWDRVGRIHVQACDALAKEAAKTPVVAVGMPNTFEGVYMLKTGLSECIEIRHGIPAQSLLNVAQPGDIPSSSVALPRYGWDSNNASIFRIQ